MSAKEVRAEITGAVWKIERQVGESVEIEDTIVILESMKMEIPIVAPRPGRIADIRVTEGDTIEEGQIVALIDV
jgi:acetyl-CoA carboxylase biotin carboxyl carrier protein